MTALLALALLAWPDPTAAREAAKQVATDEGLQTELPANAPAVVPEPPPMNFSGGAKKSPRIARPPADSRGLGQIVLIAVAGLVVVGLLAVLLREFKTGRGPPEAAATRPADAVFVAPERTVLDDAERLAAAGRFAEAVHALLMRTIEALGRQIVVSRALTSREILARAGLPTDARVALADLVSAVEITRFGGRGADADDYARCVACFDRIRVALGARA